MSLAEKLGNTYNNLNTSLIDINSALVSKGVNRASNINDISAKIRTIKTDGSNDVLIKLIEGSHIESLIIPDGVTKISKNAFYAKECLRDVIIPESVTEIGSYAFYSCLNLKSINIPINITEIGVGAFESCFNISSSIIIPEGVTTVREKSFFACNKIASITIPSTVTSIDFLAFSGCGTAASVFDIYLNPQSPPSLYSTNSIPDIATIHVPMGSGDAYKSATNWSYHSDRIVEDIVV